MMHKYEVRQRKDHRGFDLISDVLPFGCLWYDAPDNAIGYAMHSSRSHDAVIRVYDDAGNVIETHEHAGRFQRAVRPQAKGYISTILSGVVLVLLGVGFINEGLKHMPAFAAYAAGGVLILLTILLVVWRVRNR